VWLADLGYAAKVRPCLVMSVPPRDEERVLCTLIPHTTSANGTRFEVQTQLKFLKAGAFDAQGVVTVPTARLIRRIGSLDVSTMTSVEAALMSWLGMGSDA
jgi:mRNA interferase MazF